MQSLVRNTPEVKVAFGANEKSSQNVCGCTRVPESCFPWRLAPTVVSCFVTVASLNLSKGLRGRSEHKVTCSCVDSTALLPLRPGATVNSVDSYVYSGSSLEHFHCLCFQGFTLTKTCKIFAVLRVHQMQPLFSVKSLVKGCSQRWLAAYYSMW